MLVLVLVISAVSSGPLSAATAGTSRLPVAKGVEPLGSTEWPSVAAQLAKNIGRDAFKHAYDRVWAYLSPTYQQAVSQSAWLRCQRFHPAAPRTVSITKVSVANATELPVDLALLGRQNVQEIELVVEYKTRSSQGRSSRVWTRSGSSREASGGPSG